MERKDRHKDQNPGTKFHVFLEMMGGILSEVMIIEGSVLLIDILIVLTC